MTAMLSAMRVVLRRLWIDHEQRRDHRAPGDPDFSHQLQTLVAGRVRDIDRVKSADLPSGVGGCHLQGALRLGQGPEDDRIPHSVRLGLGEVPCLRYHVRESGSVRRQIQESGDPLATINQVDSPQWEEGSEAEPKASGARAELSYRCSRGKILPGPVCDSRQHHVCEEVMGRREGREPKRRCPGCQPGRNWFKCRDLPGRGLDGQGFT